VAKVADFGVAARAASFGCGALEEAVVGSPYWMAPEIIEMSAPPSAACDIWSLGCTILELTTGRPPHFELAPMAALFRIVQDEGPRLPAGASEALRDFLLQCFNREAVLRAGAKSLLCHAWLQRAPERTLRVLSASAAQGVWSITRHPITMRRGTTALQVLMMSMQVRIVQEEPLFVCGAHHSSAAALSCHLPSESQERTAAHTASRLMRIRTQTPC